ncbi:uncharacterized protein N7483_000822 [Penicillium malachiteum]|uniref:uncharacterized protein n=1 Tax=Penicillium malachiteum TaxID=1324776 RepID=UPI0025484F39|nr:uncharacterized protein N7483_000822 [Penicillium malachiteum]KAJ5735697.1 hypothetical protein N7483_000822 [Penicillium malachiteum]
MSTSYGGTSLVVYYGLKASRVLEELLASAIIASATHQQVTLFVNALDEAEAESAQRLADYFHHLVSKAKEKNVALKACFSSRHYPIIGSDHALEINVEDHNQKDIALYIEDKLIGMKVYTGSTRQITRRGLVEELTQQANRVFQWARLTIPLIKQKILEGESIDEIRDWLHDVPAGLEDVYVYILNNVIADGNRDQSFLFFQWLCLAERLLTVTEMRYALGAKDSEKALCRSLWEKIHGFIEDDERMKQRIKALAGGLAKVVSNGPKQHQETIQVVHQSVNDFLRTKRLALLSSYTTSASDPLIDTDKIISWCQGTLY